MILRGGGPPPPPPAPLLLGQRRRCCRPEREGGGEVDPTHKEKKEWHLPVDYYTYLWPSRVALFCRKRVRGTVTTQGRITVRVQYSTVCTRTDARLAMEVQAVED